MKVTNGRQGRKWTDAELVPSGMCLNLIEDGKLTKLIRIDNDKEWVAIATSMIGNMPALEMRNHPRLVKLAKMLLATVED